jgi:hypothetical protein
MELWMLWRSLFLSSTMHAAPAKEYGSVCPDKVFLHVNQLMHTSCMVQMCGVGDTTPAAPVHAQYKLLQDL